MPPSHHVELEDLRRCSPHAAQNLLLAQPLMSLKAVAPACGAGVWTCQCSSSYGLLSAFSATRTQVQPTLRSPSTARPLLARQWAPASLSPLCWP